MKNITPGYAQIPNSIIENLDRMSPSELELVLIIFRAVSDGSATGGFTTITNRHWENWTGKTRPAKELATRGRHKKGLLVKTGRGELAKYAFSDEGWLRLLGAANGTPKAQEPTPEVTKEAHD